MLGWVRGAPARRIPKGSTFSDDDGDPADLPMRSGAPSGVHTAGSARNLDTLGILSPPPYFTSDFNTSRIPNSNGTSTQIALVTPRCAHSAAVRAPS